jgi:hypothetical protein
MQSLKNNWTLRAALLLGGIGLLMLRLFDPATSGIFPPCPLHYFTGWYCPGCGSLRAIHQLLHGHFYQAWAMNPLTLILLPFLMYGLASSVMFQLRGRGLPEIFLPATLIRALCAIILTFGILRNIPIHPLNLLAPGALLHF